MPDLIQDPHQLRLLERRLGRTRARIALLRAREEAQYDLLLASVGGPVTNEAGQFLIWPCPFPHHWAGHDERGTWYEYRLVVVSDLGTSLERFLANNEHHWVTLPLSYAAPNRCGLLDIYHCRETGAVEFFDRYLEESVVA